MKEIGIMDTKIDATSAPDSTSAPSRREAMKLAASVGVGLGFAAAVLPVQAQSVIQTTAEGLQAGWVSIDVAGFAMRAYRAAPAGRSNLPVVMVVPEIFGVHEHICDVTRRLAHQGYLAIAPDLMQRQGDLPAAAQLDQQLSEQFPRDARPWLALALVRQQQGDGQASQRALVQARSRLGGQGAQRLDQVAVSWGLADLRGPSGAPARSSGAGAAAN